VWNGIHDKYNSEGEDKRVVHYPHPNSNGGEVRLLVVQEICNDHSGYFYVFDCGWYGSKYNYDTKNEAVHKEH